MQEKEVKIVAESLNDYNDNNELFEGIKKDAIAKIIELAKAELTEEIVDQNIKLISKIINKFAGKNDDAAKAKKKVLEVKHIPSIKKFLIAFAQKAMGKKNGELIVSWDPNKKMVIPRVANVSSGETGPGGRKW